MLILAIDPGSTQSGWLTYDSVAERPVAHGKADNEELLAKIRRLYGEGPPDPVDVVVIEWTAPRGMPASAELFETMWWAGRFAEAASAFRVERVNRLKVKQHLTGQNHAKDANVRAALIDRFGGIGGKAAAIGVKASPGPLHGIANDAWSALAVAVVFAEQGTP